MLPKSIRAGRAPEVRVMPAVLPARGGCLVEVVHSLFDFVDIALLLNLGRVSTPFMHQVPNITMKDWADSESISTGMGQI